MLKRIRKRNTAGRQSVCNGKKGGALKVLREVGQLGAVYIPMRVNCNSGRPFQLTTKGNCVM